MVKEIGGYIELDRYNLPMRHEGAVALNCGRSALQYICVAKHINKIWLPYFLCESVYHLLSKCNVKTCFYELDRNFIPKLDAVQNEGDWVYIVNYYESIIKPCHS